MHRSNVFLILLALMVCNARPGAASALTSFSLSGPSILRNGAEFTIHGLNINGPGMPGNHKVAADIGMIADIWKFNLVRVACSIAPSPESLKDASTLDEIVRSFTSRDIVVLISPRDHVGGFYEDPAKPDKSPSLTDLIAWQKSTAAHYKDNPNVWFEVMASPGNRDVKLTSEDWLDSHERVIRAIREDAGAQNFIVCMGYGQGSDDGNVGALQAPDSQSAILTFGPDLEKRFSNIVFAFNAMEGWNAGGAIKLNNYLDRVQLRRLPVFVTEFGLHSWADSTYAAEAVLTAGKTRKLGHCVWQWSPGDRSVLCASDNHNGGWEIDKSDGSRPTNLSWLGDRVWIDNHVEPFHGASLDRTGWTATTFRGDRLKNGQLNSADVALGGFCSEDDIWRSETAQEPGQWFRVDMGAKHVFTRVLIDTRAHGSDYPRAYELYASNDGVNWGTPVAVGKNEQSVLRISFPVQSARYIKFVQTGKSWHHWYIGNFEVFAPFGTAAVAGGQMPAKETLLDMHGWLATASPRTWSDVHVALRPLQYEWERAGSNRNSTPGDLYQVDMQEPHKFNKIVLNSGRFINEFPRSYEVYVSANGSDWGTKPIAAGRGAPITTIVLPPTTARYIRIVETRESTYQWVIAEFRVYSSS